MAKVFYTERDIDDLKARGVTSLDVTDNVVVTDVAAERAMKHGIRLNRVEFKALTNAPSGPFTKAPAAPNDSPAAGPVDSELKEKIKSAVLARVNGQVDPVLLDAVISRILAAMS